MLTLEKQLQKDIDFPQIMPRASVNIGFVRLCDAAALIIAEEKGLFKKQGVRVLLTREVGWATIRDKVAYSELDLAQALAPMVLGTRYSLTSQRPCVTGLVLSLNGNSIILTNRLAERGIRNAEDLKNDIRSSGAWQPHIFGVVSPFSSHNFLMRKWLKDGGIDPDKEVKIVNLPPDQTFRNIVSGNISGFCAGEPWCSLAVEEDVGWRAVTSLDLFPNHPEKVLMASESFADNQAEQHEALIAALYEASLYCENRENREEVIQILASEKYLNCDATLLNKSMVCFDSDLESKEIHRPSQDKANWIIDQMAEGHLFLDRNAGFRPNPESVFREDIYQAALKRLG